MTEQQAKTSRKLNQALAEITAAAEKATVPDEHDLQSLMIDLINALRYDNKTALRHAGVEGWRSVGWSLNY